MIIGTKIIFIAAIPLMSKIKTIKQSADRITAPASFGIPKTFVNISPHDESMTIRPHVKSKNINTRKNF